jgi:hypothetical protein
MSRLRLSTSISTLGVAVLTAAALGLVGAPPAAAAPFGYAQLNKIQQRHVSGLLASVLNGDDTANRAAPVPAVRPAPPAAGQNVTSTGCPNSYGGNVKVSQNCLNIDDADVQGRGQSQNETWAAADPNNPSHVVASYNDYRRGDGTCGASYTIDGGRSWADSTTPNGFTRGATFGGLPRQYWQAGGDTSVAWDTKGNAYLSCQVFNRGNAVSSNPDQSSAFYLFRSTGSNGASWNFTGRPVVEHNDVAGAGNFLLDKQLMTVDHQVGSPFQDRIYVSWTTFAADGTAYIYEAHSNDYGESFSAPVLVSGNTSLCANTFGLPTPQGACNSNQDSQPFTGPDGALYVVYNNFNNSAASTSDNHNQVLLARSTDGGQTFSAPVLVGNYNDLPDCAAYQNGADPGRACVPEKGPSANSVFRASNYPIGAVDPTHPNTVVVTYGSYINRGSNETTGCTPAGFSATTGIGLYTGVKSGTCNNDILLSTSTDSGARFTGTTVDPRKLPVVTTAAGQSRTDQYFQGAAFDSAGRFVVSYYDRQYGQDENLGFSDITASTTHNPTAATPAFQHVRVTSGSMPPPTQFSGTFYGDYAGLAVTANVAFPIWSDTRPNDLFLCAGTGTPGNPPKACLAGASNASIANNEAVYTGAVNIP